MGDVIVRPSKWVGILSTGCSASSKRSLATWWAESNPSMRHICVPATGVPADAFAKRGVTCKANLTKEIKAYGNCASIDPNSCKQKAPRNSTLFEEKDNIARWWISASLLTISSRVTKHLSVAGDLAFEVLFFAFSPGNMFVESLQAMPHAGLTITSSNSISRTMPD